MSGAAFRSESPAAGSGRTSPQAAGFVLRVLVWVVALFGLLRLPWVQNHLLIPFAGLQQNFGCLITGAPKSAVAVDLSCTGSDAMALCLGAILAFPVPWRRRLIGAAAGLALITALNTARIGTLSLVVGVDGNLFRLLHIYVWPTVLVVVAAGYVFLWMNSAGPGGSSRSGLWPLSRSAANQRWGRFLAATLGFVLAYYAVSRWFLRSDAILALAEGSAAVAGLVLSGLGMDVEVTDNVLRTAHGGWLVTQECIATPLIPVYLAAVWVAPLSLGRRLLCSLAAIPLFSFLGTARLLVLALPAALVGSHLVAIHAFYQVVTALVLVVLAVAVGARSGPQGEHKSGLRASVIALASGAVAAVAVGVLDREWLRPLFDRLTLDLHLGHGYGDPQGALAILPAFELGVFVAVLVALGRRFDRATLAALLFLLLSQPATLIVFGEWATHSAIGPPVVLIRAVALAVPVTLVWAMRLLETRPSLRPLLQEGGHRRP